LAPPRLSVERNVDAEAHAVDTRSETERPDSSTVVLRVATSASPTSSPCTGGTGSCHSCGSGTQGPRKRSTGPMSRWSSLYQALANATENSLGFSRKRREIFSYSGSNRRARSLVSMVGLRFGESGAGPGTMSSASLATHWKAPAGLLVSSHSYLKRNLKKSLLHRVGVEVQVTSRPEVIASAPLPEP
jgi:hypothetical protein